MRSAIAKATLLRRKPKQQPHEAHARQSYEQQPPQKHRRLEERTTDQLPAKDETSHRHTHIKRRDRHTLHTLRACLKALLNQRMINTDSQGYIDLTELTHAIEKHHTCNIPVEASRALATNYKCFHIISDEGHYWIKDTASHNVTAHSVHRDISPEQEYAHSKAVDKESRSRPHQATNAPPAARHATPPPSRRGSTNKPPTHPYAIRSTAAKGSAPVRPKQTHYTKDDQPCPLYTKATQLPTTLPQ